MKIIKSIQRRRRAKRDTKIKNQTIAECATIDTELRAQERTRIGYKYRKQIESLKQEMKELISEKQSLIDEKNKNKNMRNELEMSCEKMEKIILRMQTKYQTVFGRTLEEIDSNLILIDKNRKKEG